MVSMKLFTLRGLMRKVYEINDILQILDKR